jgi:prefoldin subunit 5
LNEKLEEKDAEIQKLKQSVDELKAMVSQLAQAKSK